MSRTPFAAGRACGRLTEILTTAPFSGRGYEPVSMLRFYTCPIPECAEPDGVTVEMYWDRGWDSLGVGPQWRAGNVVVNCGCNLTAREVDSLRERAEDESNG